MDNDDGPESQADTGCGYDPYGEAVSDPRQGQQPKRENELKKTNLEATHATITSKPVSSSTPEDAASPTIPLVDMRPHADEKVLVDAETKAKIRRGRKTSLSNIVGGSRTAVADGKSSIVQSKGGVDDEVSLLGLSSWTSKGSLDNGNSAGEVEMERDISDLKARKQSTDVKSTMAANTANTVSSKAPAVNSGERPAFDYCAVGDMSSRERAVDRMDICVDDGIDEGEQEHLDTTSVVSQLRRLSQTGSIGSLSDHELRLQYAYETSPSPHGTISHSNRLGPRLKSIKVSPTKTVFNHQNSKVKSKSGSRSRSRSASPARTRSPQMSPSRAAAMIQEIQSTSEDADSNQSNTSTSFQETVSNSMELLTSKLKNTFSSATNPFGSIANTFTLSSSTTADAVPSTAVERQQGKKEIATVLVTPVLAQPKPHAATVNTQSTTIQHDRLHQQQRTPMGSIITDFDLGTNGIPARSLTPEILAESLQRGTQEIQMDATKPDLTDDQSAGFTAWMQGLYGSVISGSMLSSSSTSETESKNRFNFVRGDVVFVPGILGTLLKDKFTNKREWLTIEKVLNITPCEISMSLHSASLDPYNRNESSSVKEDGSKKDTSTDGKPKESGKDTGDRIVIDEVFEKFGPINVCGKFTQEMEDLCKERKGDVRFHKIGFDWRKDMAQVADELLEKLVAMYESNGRKKITYIAHSLGGLLGIHLINRRPDIFRGAVFVGSPMKPVPIVLWAFKRGFPILPNPTLFDRDFIFLMRSAYIFLPLDGKGLVDKNDRDILIDYLDPQAWFKYGFVPRKYCDFGDETGETVEEDDDDDDSESDDGSELADADLTYQFSDDGNSDNEDVYEYVYDYHDGYSHVYKEPDHLINISGVDINGATLSKQIAQSPVQDENMKEDEHFDARSCCSNCCDLSDPQLEHWNSHERNQTFDNKGKLSYDNDHLEMARKWGLDYSPSVTPNSEQNDDKQLSLESNSHSRRKSSASTHSTKKIKKGKPKEPVLPPVQNQSQYTINKKTGKLELRPTREQVVRYLSQTLDNVRAFRLSMIHNPEREYPPISIVNCKKLPTLSKFRASISAVKDEAPIPPSTSDEGYGMSKLNPFGKASAASLSAFFGMKLPMLSNPLAGATLATATVGGAVTSTADELTTDSGAVASEDTENGKYHDGSAEPSGSTSTATGIPKNPVSMKNIGNSQHEIAEEIANIQTKEMRDGMAELLCDIHGSVHHPTGSVCTKCISNSVINDKASSEPLPTATFELNDQKQLVLNGKKVKRITKRKVRRESDGSRSNDNNRIKKSSKSKNLHKNKKPSSKESTVNDGSFDNKLRYQHRVKTTKAARQVDILWPKEVVQGDGIVAYEMTKLPQGYKYHEFSSSFGHVSIMNDLEAIRNALHKFDFSDH